MQFQQMIRYPFPAGGAQSLAGYLETLAFAQARLHHCGLDTVRVTAVPDCSPGEAHVLKYFIDLSPAKLSLPAGAQHFLPPRVKAQVEEHWEGVVSGQPRGGRIICQVPNLPVTVTAQWSLWAPSDQELCRQLEGELRVRVPLVGKTIEEKLVHQVFPEICRVEEELAARWVSQEL